MRCCVCLFIAIACLAVRGDDGVGNVQVPVPASRPAATQPAGSGTQAAHVIYVFSPTCAKCKEASATVDAAERRFGPRVRVERLNFQDAGTLERVLELESRYRAEAAPPPRVFAGASCLTGVEQIAAGLDAAIERQLARATSQPHRDAGTSAPDERISP